MAKMGVVAPADLQDVLTKLKVNQLKPLCVRHGVLPPSKQQKKANLVATLLASAHFVSTVTPPAMDTREDGAEAEAGDVAMPPASQNDV